MAFAPILGGTGRGIGRAGGGSFKSEKRRDEDFAVSLVEMSTAHLKYHLVSSSSKPSLDVAIYELSGFGYREDERLCNNRYQRVVTACGYAAAERLKIYLDVASEPANYSWRTSPTPAAIAENDLLHILTPEAVPALATKVGPKSSSLYQRGFIAGIRPLVVELERSGSSPKASMFATMVAASPVLGKYVLQASQQIAGARDGVGVSIGGLGF